MARRALVRWALATLAVVVLTAAAAAAPHWLRGAEVFRVRRVDVLGTHYMDPHEVLRASGITRASSVFDDPTPWRQRLLRLPLVAGITIQRHLPSTLVLRVTETRPLALARTPDLEPVDAQGRVLPVRPGTPLDLPVLDLTARVGADGRLAAPAALGLLRVLADIGERAPELAPRISEVAPLAGGSARLRLRDPALDVLLPLDPTTAALRHLREALADVRARGELPRLRRIDARFADQIVVAFDTHRPR